MVPFVTKNPKPARKTFYGTQSWPKPNYCNPNPSLKLVLIAVGRIILRPAGPIFRGLKPKVAHDPQFWCNLAKQAASAQHKKHTLQKWYVYAWWHGETLQKFHKMKSRKNDVAFLEVYLLQKFCSVSLDHFIDHESLISEEWTQELVVPILGRNFCLKAIQSKVSTLLCTLNHTHVIKGRFT